MANKDFIVYDYIHRNNIIGEAVNKCLRKIYNLSFPKVDYDETILPNCKKYAKQFGEDNIIYLDGTDGKKYNYPYDFYYIPMDFSVDIIDNFAEAYGLVRSWENHVDTVHDYINNIDNSAIIEVYNKDENGIHQRSYEHIPSVVDKFKEIVDEDTANKLVEIVNDYIEKCKKFYRFGLREENYFRGGVVFRTPTSNRQTVIDAWKYVFNKDIEIPDDSMWVDEYSELLEDE